jgi:hypothetical protein
VELVNDVLALDNSSEDDVLAVEPGAGDEGDEELGAVGSGAGVGHGQQVGDIVLLLEVLILELGTVDGLASGAVLVGEVTALSHEVGDDAVEGGSLVAKALLSSAESPEVFGGLGHDVVVELEGDLADGFATDRNFEPHFRPAHDLN